VPAVVLTAGNKVAPRESLLVLDGRRDSFYLPTGRDRNHGFFTNSTPYPRRRDAQPGRSLSLVWRGRSGSGLPDITGRPGNTGFGVYETGPGWKIIVFAGKRGRWRAGRALFFSGRKPQ